MTAKALTTTAVSSAKPKSKPYKLSDLDRLYVLVSTAGSKTWKWGYRLDDKDCTYTLGKFPAMGVADARARRAELQKIVDTGAHPRDADERARAAVQAEQANTLWAVVEEWLALKKPGWSPVYAGQIETLLTRYVQPALGHMPVREITAKHIYTTIRAIAVRKTRAKVERKDTAPHAAAITRRTLDGVFRFAIMTDRADVNPVTALRAADVITAPPTRNNRALSPDELRALLLSIDAYTGRELTRIALTLLLLLFVRTGELRGARWSEFDFENAVWSIPAARTKMRRPHLVPLAPLVLSVLRRLREITGGYDLLFPNEKDDKRPMSARRLNEALKRLGFNGTDTIGFSAHGARGTASTLLHERGERPEVIEAQLAHIQGGVAGVYNKAQHLQERTAMMRRWAEYIAGLSVTSSMAAYIEGLKIPAEA